MDWTEKMDSFLIPPRRKVLFAVLLLLYAAFLTYRVSEPLIGTQAAMNGLFGIPALNWIYRGPAAVDFGMMVPYGSEVPSVSAFANGNFYLNHPQLFIAPEALSFWLFGAGEWQTRLYPIIFSLIGFALFWLLMSRVFKKPWLTAASSVFYISFPIGIYFGRLFVEDPIVLPFILALFLLTVVFEEERRQKYLWLMGAVVFFGGFADFQFFLAAAAAFGYVAVKKNYPARRKALLIIAATSAASLGITLFQIGVITGISPFRYLLALFLDRSAGARPSVLSLLMIQGNFDLINFTEVALVLALIGLVFYISKGDKERLLFGAMLLFPGLMNVLIFSKMSVFDQYWELYLVPFAALMAARGIGRIRRVRFAAAVFVLFAASSFIYTRALFTYKAFADDDFALFRRAEAAVPQSERICMGDNPPTLNENFYLFPHFMDYFPCRGSDQVFLLRRTESFLDQPPLIPWLFSNGIAENLQRTSLLAAFTIDAVKHIPPLENKVRNMLARYEPRQTNNLFARHVQEAIDDYHLRALDCSTNFCLYQKGK